MANGQARRTDEFIGGAYTAAFKPLSVLDVTRPSGVGFGEKDRERLLPGGQRLPSANGQASDTWEARQKSWLDSPSPYKTFG